MEWWEDLDDLWKALIISIGIVIIPIIIAGIISYNVQLSKLNDNTGKVIDKKYEILITKEGAKKWIEVTKEEFEKYKIGDIANNDEYSHEIPLYKHDIQLLKEILGDE